jgi:predicted transcriptional regulator
MREISIEDIICSKSIIRILRYLIQNDISTQTTLIRESRTNYNNFIKQIEKLIKIGIVEKKRVGGIILFKINKTNPLYEKLQRVLEIY